MFSEQLAVMLFIAASQLNTPNLQAPRGPVVEDGRQTMIRNIKEPELVAALKLRAKRPGMRTAPEVSSPTMLASR
jgi:hypothetical protein